MISSREAARLAEWHHTGQLDKSGATYIDHPRRVAERLVAEGAADEVVAVAWLHDVLEDTPCTVEELLAHGASSEQMAALDALSHRERETRETYIARIAGNAIARQVKRADIDDNTDPERLALLDTTQRDRLKAKYERDLAQLDAAP